MGSQSRMQLTQHRVVLFLIFWWASTNLHFPLTVHKDCLFSTFLSILVSFLAFVLIIVFLTGEKWYLVVVLICISLMVSDIEHLFMCLLAICTYSLEKCLFKSSAQFLNFFFCSWAVGVPYIFWILISYQKFWEYFLPQLWKDVDFWWKIFSASVEMIMQFYPSFC